MSYFTHIRALTIFIAFSLLLLQPSAFAQEQEQQKYKEFIYFFSPDFFNGVEPADEECAAAIANLSRLTNIQDINPNNNGRVKLYSVALGKKGKVLDDRVEEIGEMLVCQDLQTYPEKNLDPFFYRITIGSRTFFVAGAGTSIEFPDAETLPGGGVQYVPTGFPNPNRTVYVWSGTVLPAVPGMRGGAYTDSRLSGYDGESEDGLSSNIVSVLRVVLPDNP
jgi:hypothetical protein